MEPKKVLKLSINNTKFEIYWSSEMQTYSDLCACIKKEGDLKSIDMDVFIQITENDPVLLTSSNYKDLILNSTMNEFSLLIIENVDSLEEIQNVNKEVNKEEEEEDIEKNVRKSNFNGECSRCKINLTGVKYICCICDDTDFCSKCEPLHDHPMFKFKTLTFAKNMNHMIKFLNNTRDKSSLKSLLSFRKDVELSTAVQYPWPIKSEETITLLIKIKWNNKTNKDYETIIKNYHDLKVSYEIKESKEIDKSDLLITITAPKKEQSMFNKKEVYNIGVFLYSVTSEKGSNFITLTIEWDEKKYDDWKKINDFFKNYQDIYYIPMEEKLDIQKVYQGKISNKGVMEIYGILKKYKFVIENAIKELTD